VLDRRLAGDRDGVVDAAVQFWLMPREGAGEDDHAQAEVWQAIVDAGAVDAAAAAGLRMIRDRHRLRPSAFLDLSEAIADRDTLVELARLVLDHGWDVRPLGAVLMRLVERGHDAALGQLIRDREARLHGDDDAWVVVGLILMTTKLGEHGELERWFLGYASRRGVPMWLFAGYVATLGRSRADTSAAQVAIARAALAIASPDVTSVYLDLVVAIDDLRNRRDDAFLAYMGSFREALAEYFDLPLREHPLVRYANRMKRRYPIRGANFAFRPSPDDDSGPASPKNRPIVELLEAIDESFETCHKVFGLFRQMLETRRGDVGIVALARSMDRVKPAPDWVRPVWVPLLRSRASTLTRIMLFLR
jgi:hypothetical protein